MVAMDDAVTVGCRFTGIGQQRPQHDALGRARGRGQQHVGVAAAELGVRLQRGVPAERLGAAHVGGEGVDRAAVEPVQAEARDRHGAPARTFRPIGVSSQVEELQHVAGRDLVGLVGRHAGEEALGEGAGVRPVALDVRESRSRT